MGTTKKITAAQRKRLEAELAMCERHVALLRDLIGQQPARVQEPGSRGPGRPNAGLRRFIVEAVSRHPGIDAEELAKSMAQIGFRATSSRTLSRVVRHELRTLVRTGHLRVEHGHIYPSSTA
jgi:hypothetical protein